MFYLDCALKRTRLSIDIIFRLNISLFKKTVLFCTLAITAFIFWYFCYNCRQYNFADKIISLRIIGKNMFRARSCGQHFSNRSYWSMYLQLTSICHRVLEGSTDGGSTWNTIDTRSSEIFETRFFRKTFTVDKRCEANAFRYVLYYWLMPHSVK